ncbi:hypothetical protein UFOVP58_33 [uncultured Caudovirales phage]|uniref:Uncharacterized protein n=1 Tax=uncultured Caudovirales phage TaxID=2100421 RepID=A0A6J5KV16_9CAUD|nr:hypothetical protein UFOVP58_33 [uncultured Caudovirales phage]
MSNFKNRFDTLIENQKELKRVFSESATALFKESTKEFFELNPGVKAVIWNQYTPYFNYGDACEFGVSCVTFTNAEGDDLCDISWGEYQGENESVWATENIEYDLAPLYKGSFDPEEQAKLQSKMTGVDAASATLLDSMIQSSEFSDVLKDMFGDHVTVVATRNGFAVESYDHD